MILLLLAMGCEDNRNHRFLPSQLSLLLQLEDGTQESVVVELGRDLRDQLDLRVSPGLRYYDGLHIWEWDGAGWKDRVRGRLLPLPEKGELLGVDRSTIWLRQGTKQLACDMRQLPEWSGTPVSRASRGIRCEERNEAPSIRLTHPGPGSGFSVWLADHQVHVRLPAEEDPQGEIVAREVSSILGVRWVDRTRKSTRPAFERLFRGRAVLAVESLPVEVDGNLEEWSSLVPLVVEQQWHLEEGGANWGGAPDASFSVAVAEDQGRLCFAGRLRDDHLSPGDHLLLRLDQQKWELPLEDLSSSSHSFLSAPDLKVVFEREWYEARYEFCVAPPKIERRYPFSLSWIDVDPGQSPTVLSTAATQEDRPLGALLVGQPPGS